ncbi:MAG: response regulator transcription factor [Armatimonadetes bacterium]|nr:response regulator transcription factor [Armatimonadota bacterium]
MAKESILVVDDEADILKLVDYNLAREGFKVKCVESGEDAIIEAKAGMPDMILLDLMLPGLDGLEVCRVLKTNSATSSIPIIMLTAKGEDADIVTGLQLGADDYIVKPFSPRVLIARVKTVLRRSKSQTPGETEQIRLHEITIDPGKHVVSIDGERVDLTLTEFRILHSLARRPGWVFTRSHILELSSGEDSEVTDRSVDVHIVSLRRKLGDAGKYVETVRGVGYRFAE